MKKLFKLAILLIFLFLIISCTKSVKANSIEKISMDIYVDNYGTAHITETWDCNASQGTEVYHPYYNLGSSEIYDLNVYESNKVYTSLANWDTNKSFSEKAYKCGINYVSNGLELCWGISEYGSHTYTVKYNISNFVSTLSDSQMIYWTLIPYEFSNTIGNAYIKIYTDFEISDTTDVWGYGNYGGTCYVYDGYIEMQSDGQLDSNEYMTILVKFPLGTFTTYNELDYKFDHYMNMAEDGSKHYSESSFKDILAMIGAVASVLFFPLIAIIAAIFEKKKSFNYGPEGKRFNKETPYFRDIPCNGNLFRAYYIATQYGIITNKTDLLGAIILKWLKDSVICVEQKEGGKLFKKESTVVVLNEANKEKLTDEYEQKIFDMLHEASKDGILEGKEFEKWCSNHYSKILSWFDNIITKEKKKLKEQNVIAVEEKKFIFFKYKVDTATVTMRKEAEEIYGLKRYLLDYTLIPDREAPEVQLFEQYLIYAQMLGIAKKVAKQFKDLYPDVIEASNFNSYDTIMFVHTYSNSAVSAASTARSRAQSYSSGGGGFSSGGGGGGSFGGGGGGGGFR